MSALLLLTAVILFIPGLGWGLPHPTAADRIYVWGSDELAPLGPIAELYSVFLDPDPRFNPQYPLFHYLIAAVLYAPYLLWLSLTGGLVQPVSTYPFGLVQPMTALPVMALIARGLSVVAAGATVVAVYLTGRVLWDRAAGVVAALLTMVSYPLVFYARTSNVDAPALCWIAWGTYLLAQCLRDRVTPRRAVALGILAALGTATKDASYAAFAGIGLVLVPRHVAQERARGANWSAAVGLPALSVGIAAAVYLVASGLVFSPARFWQHVEFVTQGNPAGRYFSTPATVAGYLGLIARTGNHLIEAAGLPAAVLAAAGVGLVARRRDPSGWLVAPALATFLLVIVPVRFVRLRFVLVMVLVLALFAGYAVSMLMSVGLRWRRVAWVALGAAGGWSLVRVGDLTYQMIHDSRYRMSAWFDRNARPGDRVGYFGAPLKLPALGAGIVTERLSGAVPGLDADPPKFVVVIPMQPTEPVHEAQLSPEGFRALRDGSAGYVELFSWQSRSLFNHRPISWVNPPVRAFVRLDRLNELADPGPVRRLP